MASIDPRITEQMRQVHESLQSHGELLSIEALQGYYVTFRQRFGPEVLADLNGEPLLNLLKGTGRDELVYWLEFKDDEEFPAKFGSIAGGSALKYGLFRRRETGAWTIGSSKAQQEISTIEAITIATRQRDQLLSASRVLDNLPEGSGDENYRELQRELARVAPDVQDSAWGHKYLSLLYPTKLDDYHAESYQRFHLIKALQRPVPEDGRYVNAGRFLSLSKELAWHVNHLTTVMNRRDGAPHRYWRVGTRSGSTQESFWDMMRERSVIAIGWHMLGNLSDVMQDEQFKETLKHRLASNYPKDPRTTGRSAQQIAHYCLTMKPRDYVIAADGQDVLGIGRIVGGYEFAEGERFPHRRKVEWLSLGNWRMPTREGLLTTVHEFRKDVENLLAIEAHVLSPGEALPPPRRVEPKPEPRAHRRWTLGGTIGRVDDVLARKSQLILYGPPGTGKTHWAERAVHELAALWNFGRPLSELEPRDRLRIVSHDEESFVRLCSFHPGYGYEDFIEGYRPTVVGGALHFTLRNGIFKDLCDRARANADGRYYLIIDEINRGDIPRIFGELLTLLEKSKRGTSLVLPLSGESFSVPENVFVVGTMNTADRSIALLDAALRRRFGFVELMPDADVLGTTVISGIPIGPWLSALNQLVVNHVGRDGRNLQIGHSYLLNAGRPIQDFSQFARVLQEDILPLLEEYCYDDWSRLELILKKGLVDRSRGRFRTELFEEGREEDLARAVLAIAPEVSASAIAVAADPPIEPSADPGDETGSEDGAPDPDEGA